jgi:AcrR family transcriptional regulator
MVLSNKCIIETFNRGQAMEESYRETALRKAESDEDSTKAKILQTSEGLFAARGYKGTTIREIAEAVGVNVALVHYHWGSKEELWNAVHRKRLDQIIRMTRELVAEFPRADSPEAVEQIISRFFGFIAENPNVVRLMVQTAGPEGARSRWLDDLGQPFLELGVEYIGQNENIDFEPVDIRMAITCILGAFLIFFIRPDLMKVMFDENPESFSDDFRKRAADALTLLVTRLGQMS